MDEKTLRQHLKNMPVPEPDEEAREAALKAAMKEFAGQKEAAKGIPLLRRLTGKIFSQGGPVMRKPLVIGTSMAALAIILFMSMPVAYKRVATRQVETSHSETDYAQTFPDEKVLEDPGAKEPPPVARAKEEPLAQEKTTVSPAEPASPPAGPDTGPREARDETMIVAKAGKKDVEQEAVPGRNADTVAGLAKEAPVSEKFRAQALSPQPSAALKAESKSKAIVAQNRSLRADTKAPQREYFGRDRFEHAAPNPVKLVSEEPVSTFSIDVDTASYSFVRRSLMKGVLPQKDAVRIEEMINYFDYDYPLPKDGSRPFKPTVAVYPTPWNPDTLLLHIGIKGHDIVPEKKPRSNLVFLIDVSGSMRSEDKLPLLKSSLAMLVETLEPEDTVGIVVYAGAAGTVIEPTKVKEKGKILSALDRLTAGGSTAGGEGIRQAYALAEANFDKQSVNRVILATDGDFNVGITNQDELKGFVERRRATGIYLSVLGFGQGNYHDALMQKLAQNGNGNAAYIDTLNEARKVLVEEASSTLFPIAKDVKIQVEFNPARVVEYRLIGYETRMLKREDFNNDKVDAGDIGSGHTVTALYEITPVGSPARLVDGLRYGAEDTQDEKMRADKKAEYAFLKIRSKLPDSDTSTLMTKPIGTESEFGEIGQAPLEARFAASVAAFGQLLRGDPYTREFTFHDVIELAGPARGRDAFGYRSEFLNLVRLAKTARGMETLPR
jgi:Ca-activated chloride channel family protein